MITCKLHLEKCLRTEMANAAVVGAIVLRLLRYNLRHFVISQRYSKASRLHSFNAPICASAPRVEGLIKSPCLRYCYNIYMHMYVYMYVYTYSSLSAVNSLQVNYLWRNLVAAAAEKGFSF